MGHIRKKNYYFQKLIKIEEFLEEKIISIISFLKIIMMIIVSDNNHNNNDNNIFHRVLNFLIDFH